MRDDKRWGSPFALTTHLNLTRHGGKMQFRRGQIRKVEWLFFVIVFFSAVRICTMLSFGKVFNYSQLLNGIRRRGEKRMGGLVSFTLQKTYLTDLS